MKIADIMTAKVETIASGESAEDAWSRMRKLRIHHLVVVQGKQIIGVISERDLGGPRGATLRMGRQVHQLMTAQVVSAAPDTSVKRAANLLRGRSAGCLPIVEAGALLGIVTISDLLELLGRGSGKAAPTGKRWTLKHRGEPWGPSGARQ